MKNGKSKGWYPGYPARYGKGHQISGIENIQDPDCKIFYAGVSNSEKKGLVTDGGRVLHVIGKGKTLSESEARDVAYRNIEKVNFEGAVTEKISGENDY